MMAAKTRLLVAAGLFVAWIGWLAYLVFRSQDAVIVSRPQFLVTQLVVTADVKGDNTQPDSTVKIVDVLWAADEKSQPPRNEDAPVLFLKECLAKNGWQGPGQYILPLQVVGKSYAITKIPLSPGYGPPDADRLRIYLASEDALRQARELTQGRKKSQ